MPKFEVTYTMTATGTYTVEDATNEEDARDEVDSMSMSDLLYEINDTDWEVDILEVEEVKSK
jgi:hypothetical protein